MHTTPAENEAMAALLDAVTTVHLAQQACAQADYGSEVSASVKQALELVTYALRVAQGAV